MTETAKTTIFLVAAVLTVSAAYFLNVTDDKIDYDQYVNQQLTKEIDLDAPRRLSIVKFDRETASVRKFEVAEVDGVWSIPSKQDYPADATQQMADAVTCLMGRKILRVEGDSEHEKYGVVDPLSPKLNSKSTGVGTRVTLSDAEDAPLIDMIIGKAVKGSENQRYVRLQNQNLVYVVELDPTKLSTNFSDWIEDHLLQLSTIDLRKVFVNDYSADLSISMTNQGYVPRISLEPRSEITLTRADESADWRVAMLKKGDLQAGKIVDDALADDEEVNQDAIRDLIAGLDELLIVDIAKKPEGLSADLKAGEAFLNEEEAVSDLVAKGFIPGRQQSGSDILSSEGELVFSQRNGVEYVLRFGQLKVQTEEDGPADAAEAAPAAEGEKPAEADAAKGENLRRYLFVTARFNEDAVEKPQYKELPELPADDAAEAAADAEAESDSDEAKDDEAKDDEAAGDDAEAKDEAKDKEADAAKAEREMILAERKSIEDENAQLREQYEALISEGQQATDRLNARFGDWYYVISNDVYKQIHLSRDQVIKKKEEPADEASAGGAAGSAAEPEATSGLPGLPGLPGEAPPAGE